MDHHQSSQAELFAVQASGQSGDGQDGQWCLVLQHEQGRLLQRDFVLEVEEDQEHQTESDAEQQQMQQVERQVEQQVEKLLIVSVSRRHQSTGCQRTERQMMLGHQVLPERQLQERHPSAGRQTQTGRQLQG